VVPTLVSAALTNVQVVFIRIGTTLTSPTLRVVLKAVGWQLGIYHIEVVLTQKDQADIGSPPFRWF
jgi:hypothetical protein